MTDRGPYIQTYSGGRAYLLDPRPEEVRLLDIAHGLSLVCRFGGHVKHHYSVAQHSVLVSHLTGPGLGIENLTGLLHDASEAYVGDIVSPLKGVLPGFKEIEHRWFVAIDAAFELGGRLVTPSADIKKADVQALAIEAHAFLVGGPHTWGAEVPPNIAHHRLSAGSAMLEFLLERRTPQQARRRFLERFSELRAGRPS